MNMKFEWLELYPQYVREAVTQLTSAPRTRGLRMKLSENWLKRIAYIFEQANSRDAWTTTTQRQRDAWVKRFEKTYAELISLMRIGPVSPRSGGLPIQSDILYKFIQRLGYPLPDPTRAERIKLDSEYNRTMLKIMMAASAETWTLEDELELYRDRCLSRAIEPQPLKKPGDLNAERARFILWMKEEGMSTGDVAIIASIVFDDNAIDERLVRRLTSAKRTVSSKI